MYVACIHNVGLPAFGIENKEQGIDIYFLPGSVPVQHYAKAFVSKKLVFSGYQYIYRKKTLPFE